MDGHTWNALVEAAKHTHTELMQHTGTVIPPTLLALKHGQLLGYVRLRLVAVGEDAGRAIAEMSTFAASARADEVVIAWETQDIATACGHPPLHPGPGLSVVAASPHGHWVYRYPYAEKRLRGRTELGLVRCRPRWSRPSAPIERGQLEPAIQAALEFSFQPLDPGATRESAAYWLEQQGYSVALTQLA